jgi:short-subunit dehydrogenase
MHVVITGASQGIGKALALEFSKTEHPCIYLIARSEAKLNLVAEECLLVNQTAKIHPISFDLDRLILEDLPLELDLPRVDILINNAGLLYKKEFLRTDADEMMGMITTNFLAPACLIQKLINKMGGSSPSHIVNIGSMGGYQGSIKFPGLSFYSASKAALASLTECLAAEIADRNIFFNCLSIGSVDTEMLTKAFPGYKAPLSPSQMAKFISDFAISGFRYFNGKVIPVSLSTP